jgi:hypothetical protein
MVSNLGDSRSVYIRQESIDENVAKIEILNKILKLSKYGLPRVYFKKNIKSQHPHLIFSHSNDYDLQGNEYIEINSEFFNILISTKLKVVILDTIKKQGLNYKAAPFIPSIGL